MPEAPLDDVRRRILTSLEAMESAGPVRRWHGQRIDSVRRDHRVALGIVDLLEDIARDLGEAEGPCLRRREDIPGGIRLVVQPTNPEAAGLTVSVDGSDVVLYPGDRGRVEMWPARRESPESFLAKVAAYVNAVVSGGFRATYSSKTPSHNAKLEFLIEGTWRRAGGVMIRGVRSRGAITRRFEPY